MKVFLDANILVTILNKEYPQFPYAAKLLSIQDKGKHKLYTSSVCLAIAFYFASKKHGSIVAKQKMALLLQHILVADCGKKEALQAAQNKAAEDFEDGLEYYTAVNAGCQCIITEDLSDFYFSEIEVLDSFNFLKKHIS